MEGKRIGFAAAFIVIALSVNAQSAFDKKLQSLYRNSVPRITPIELQGLLKGNKKILLLDTRKPEEYNVSHLPGAVLINYNTYTVRAFDRFDRKAKVIVYCTVGYRSERVGEKLLKLGFTDVHNLYGGIMEWKNEGFSTLNRNNKPTDSVHGYNKNWSRWLLKGIKVY